MNRYGVDVSYFEKELAALSRSLPNRTPAELERYLIRLAKVARPHKVKKLSKPKQALSIDQQTNDVWYSVKDKLPNPNVNCLTYSPNVNGIYRVLCTYNGRFFSDITHWMYLPKGPANLITTEDWLDAHNKLCLRAIKNY